MKKEQITKLINEGCKIKVFTTPDKNYKKMILKTALINENNNNIYFIYYNHVKKFLNKNQLNFIEVFNRVKNFKFSDKVDLNIKSKNNTLNKNEHENLIMIKSLNKMEYLEQY